MQEATNIKKQITDFSTKVLEFRVEFQRNCPYHIEDSSAEIINGAYDTIERYYQLTGEMEEEAKKLNNLETLFDIQKSTYKPLKDCKNELLALKYMWDLIALIDYQFVSWKKTLWEKINTDQLEQLIKDMQQKQTNPNAPQNKDIKNWKAFVELNERVKNMNTILPLISQLHSKYILERHWKKLMSITGKTINFSSPQFCMDDLVQLNLFKYTDDVVELVESATREARIEGKLKNIERTWDDQQFEFKEYKETYILGPMEEIVEFVDTHQMELMQMLSGKDVDEFKDKVVYWLKAVRTVDSVI